MKKYQTNGFISGMLVMALIIGLIGTATAAAGQRSENLNFMDIKITLDGQVVTPTDVEGNVVEPFAIDGTTYLPVRGIASALGLDVTWDDTTNTVVLNDIPQEDITDSEYKVAIQNMYVYCRLISSGRSVLDSAELLKIYADLETDSAQLEKSMDRCSRDEIASYMNEIPLISKIKVRNEDLYLFNYLSDARDKLAELNNAVYEYRRTKDSETYKKISQVYSAVIQESTKLITAADKLLTSELDNSQKKR